MRKGTDFKKGDYVVLLSSCTGDPKTWSKSLDVDCCYKLKQDSAINCFYPEKYMCGNSNNGWSCSTHIRSDIDKLMLREATSDEIAHYDMMKGPFKTIPIIEPKELPIFN